MQFPPTHRHPKSTSPLATNAPLALCSSHPPSTLLLASFVLTSTLVLSPNEAQVLLQDQRSISNVRFRLPASLNDGITFPHHQIQTLGSFSLMLENWLHFILLLTIDHHGRRRPLLPFGFLGLVESFEVGDMKDRIDPPIWGQIQCIWHWRNHLRDW